MNTADPQQIGHNTPVAIDPDQDLAHVATEIYKKNTELFYTNKTLSILRKIDDIILGTVTDPVQVAQQVANAVVPEAEYKLVSIFLHDQANKVLFPLAISQTELIREVEQKVSKNLINMKIDVTDTKNLISVAVQAKIPQVTNVAYDIYSPFLDTDQGNLLQNTLGIGSIIIYPLVVRNEVIGVMVICCAQEVKALTPKDRDLMDRISQVVGIAVDNALLYEKIQAANIKLQELDRLKDEFVSLASHELRTPLTAIKSYLWMAITGKGGELNEKQKYYLERSYQAADRLSKLVNDMLNVSRIESGRIILDKKNVSIVSLVEDIFGEVTPRAQELGVKLTLVKSEMPSVSADTDKIKEVIINLVGNSLKFTPAGGEVSVSFEKNENMIKTIVHDTGRGISPEGIGKLFQKFGILEGTYTQNQQSQGTGLGLYITKSIVELHGGKIWAESAGVGKGTSFMFTLPIYTESSQAPKV